MKLRRLMYTTHLWSSLFLLPFLLVYAVSAFVLNHGDLFRENLRATQQFRFVRQEEFVPDAAFPAHPPDQAEAVLRALNLQGPHHVDRRSTAEALVIIRRSAAGAYRIIWVPSQSRIIVERQPFSLWRLFNQLHFSHGYGSSFARLDVWAFFVDLLIVSIWLWAISGVYMWAVRGGKKHAGAICLAAGIVFFAILVAALCS